MFKIPSKICNSIKFWELIFANSPNLVTRASDDPINTKALVFNSFVVDSCSTDGNSAVVCIGLIILSTIDFRRLPLPLQAFADGSNGVVRHREEHDVGGVEHFLRVAARPARHAGDRIAAAREREREALADAAGADEAQPFSRDKSNPGDRARAAAPAIREGRSPCPPSARRVSRWGWRQPRCRA